MGLAQAAWVGALVETGSEIDSSERVVTDTRSQQVTSVKVISANCPRSTCSRKAVNVVSMSFADFSSARIKSAVYVAVAHIF